MSLLATPLSYLLTLLYNLVHNYGIAIIILTVIVKAALYPVYAKSMKSTMKMGKLQPKMQELQQKYGVSMTGSCLTALIQMPIFIALYWTLMESTELRQSSFMLWITDLSVKDPFFVLPILYGVTMFYLQKMSPTPVTDPVQRKVFMAMPFVFTFMFCTFPAGLTLYWLVSNCFTILQQYVIFRSLEKRGLSMKKQPVSK